jgi:hypothetical protein
MRLIGPVDKCNTMPQNFLLAITLWPWIHRDHPTGERWQTREWHIETVAKSINFKYKFFFNYLFKYKCQNL